MEFRIAPLIIVILNILYLMFINPDINNSVPLAQVSSILKMLFPAVIMFGLALGSFFRHSFYSKPFKYSYWILQIGSLILMIWYILSIRAQHL